ncbi:MAG: hypothetical protein QOI89_265 [Solirubrobacteraceae bacterium]|jgi:hypothetical protein|nr:hypothetical protein [Solirubrobacteraceae bacterium]
MRSHARISVLALLAGAIVVLSAPAAAQAAFGVESWFAANCKVNTCKKVPPAEEKEKAELEGFTQAAGHPNFGITDFRLNTFEAEPGFFVPQENIKNLRVDVAPGVSTNPEAVEKCSVAEFTSTLVEPVKHIYLAPKCGPGSIIGENKVTTILEVAPGKFADVALTGTVYNLVQPEGLSSYFGVAIQVGAGVFVHTFIEGNVEWGAQAVGTGRADYHDYFEIKNISPGLISSRLSFKGNIGTGGFLTNPTSCTGIGPQTTTRWRGESDKGVVATAEYSTPIGTDKCALVPFQPGFALIPGTTQSDQPDGATVEVSMPHDPDPAKLDSSQLKTATTTLPEGLTLNESAAHGLEACTPKQARITSPSQGVDCPEGSKLGTVLLNVPGLPPKSLEGSIYLGGPESGPITGNPYTIYLDAESKQYGLSVRLKGVAVANESTGQVTATFAENPEQPFSNAILTFKSGPRAPLANPLACGEASTEEGFTPFSGTATVSRLSKFVVDSDGKGGACSSPLPFAPTQGTSVVPSVGGAKSAFTFNLERPTDGQQYLKEVSTVLPPGLVGLIPAVEQCSEAQATSATCPAGSQVGTVSVLAGAGTEPFEFKGNAYLTGPYKGAPYGMAFIVPAVAGPFNLGNVVTRATINVEQFSGRVVIGSVLPTVVHGGVRVRLKRVTVNVSRPGYLLNPTNCSVLATESTVIGNFGASKALSTPFQVSNCSALAFKPAFKAKTGAKASKANGASLETTLNLPAGGSNVKSVLVTLPTALPSRLTTLQKACPEATFKVNPFSCPPGSFVGGVRANTPTLPAKMKGPAILVSHGGAAFPDLDLVLEGNGVRVILVGNTDIKKGITTTNFAATPDVPVSSITVNLPVGAHSALAAHGNLCTIPLAMPTVITGQNGKVVKQKTKIGVNGCGVQIVGHKVIGRTAYITVRTFAAGRISGKGSGLATVFRRLRTPAKATTLKVPLRRGAHGPRRVRLRVGFLPSNRKLGSSASTVTVFFR